MLANLKIKDFLEKTGSGTAVPGGGSAAALNAALGASLAEMVANLTIGKIDYEAVEKEMQETATTASELREKLVKYIDKDSESYKAVLAAFRLPRNNAEEKNRRTQAIQEGLKNASLVPLSVARDAFNIMDLADIVIKRGNKSAVTDGAVAAMTARTAVLASLYNVKINLASITDAAFVEEVTKEVKNIENQVGTKEKEILSKVNL